ncbi:hypothetical protein TNCV_4968761 [Trichonephila clavipes]|nr:hypothetical protein TNCV_4968761 [Trichonephila clavipes]
MDAFINMPTEFHCHRYVYHLPTEDQIRLLSLLTAHTKGSKGEAPSFEYRIPPEPYGTSFDIDPCERLKAVVSILCTYSNEVLFNSNVFPPREKKTIFNWTTAMREADVT